MKGTRNTVFIRCADQHRLVPAEYDYACHWWTCPMCGKRTTAETIYFGIESELGNRRN